MTANLIDPEKLEADAVVPQCLDNQYVSDRLFSYLAQNNVDYENSEFHKLREKEIKTEFVRSLVYSSQVVINRVFLKNDEYLYKNYLLGAREEFLAFAGLLRDRAVLPFLYKESSLVDNLETDIREEGGRAIQMLAREVGDDVACVRLATEDASNQLLTEKLAAKFRTGLAGIGLLLPEQRNAMAAELFGTPDRLHKAGWEAFDRALTDLAEYGYREGRKLADQGRALTRSDVYRDLLVVADRDKKAAGKAITLGRFRKADQENPFVLELKKIVDLIYNTNLPDMLQRYTFTPVTLPSRTALQDDPVASAHKDELQKLVTDPAALQYVRKTFMANAHRAMNLPLLSDLTMADVVELRKMSEWQAFKDSQTLILKDPRNCLSHFEGFQQHFDQFQRAMSGWYNAKYERPKTEEKYVNVVSFVIRIAGEAFTLAMAKDHDFAKTLVRTATNLIPKKVKGYAAKLMVGVYDIGKQRLDNERSYSVELMRTNEELTREDVLDLINKIVEKGGATPLGNEADQGKQ